MMNFGKVDYANAKRLINAGAFHLYKPATSTDNKMITGMFMDKDSAEKAYLWAVDAGYSDKEINVVMSEDTKHKYYGAGESLETVVGSKAAEGAAIGGVIGGTVGAVSAAIAAAGTTLLMPGLGLVIAGPLAAGVAGAGAGSLTAGLVGALIGWGIPEERVKHYEQGLQQGGILIGVTPRSDDDIGKFERNWQDNRAQHVYTN